MVPPSGIRICGVPDPLAGGVNMGKTVIKLEKPSDAAALVDLVRASLAKKRVEIAMTAYQQISISTPVDTGRLRNGWMPSINVQSDYLPPEGKYSFPDIMGRVSQAWANSTIEDVLYIVNNVPYGVYLNNGTVHIAPRRFVERTITVINNAFSG